MNTVQKSLGSTQVATTYRAVLLYFTRDKKVTMAAGFIFTLAVHILKAKFAKKLQKFSRGPPCVPKKCTWCVQKVLLLCSKSAPGVFKKCTKCAQHCAQYCHKM